MNNNNFGPPPHAPTYAGASPTPNPMNVEHQASTAATMAGTPPANNLYPPAAATPIYLVGQPPRKSSPVDCMQIINLGLRVACLLFSFISFVLIVTIKGFEEFDACSYLVAMSVISSVYAVFQIVMAVIRLVSGKSVIPEKISAAMDFIIDQVMAYLLMSTSSALSAVTMLLKDQGYSSDEWETALAKTAWPSLRFSLLLLHLLRPFIGCSSSTQTASRKWSKHEL